MPYSLFYIPYQILSNKEYFKEKFIKSRSVLWHGGEKKFLYISKGF